MSIKIVEHKPEPLPPPPMTYSLDGLLYADMVLLRKALQIALRAGSGLVVTIEERKRLDRMQRVIVAKAPI